MSQFIRIEYVKCVPVVQVAALAALLCIVTAWVWAHEGHQALPTRGVSVDVEKGTLVLGPDAIRGLGVEIADVEKGALPDDLVAPATVVAPWQGHAFVSARSGGRVTGIHVRPGQSVKKGQRVAEIESLELTDLQRDLLDAHNETHLSEKTLKAVEDGFLKGSIPQQTFLEVRTTHRQNLNSLAIARRKLLLLGVSDAEVDRLLRAGKQTLRTLAVHSTVAGTVLHVDVGVGQIVEPNEHLLEVVDLSRVAVQIRVLEKDLPRVAAGQAVTVRLAGGSASSGDWTGKVQVSERYLDPQTHWGTAWAELPNPQGRLVPGLFGQARIRRSSSEGLLLPASALVVAGAERYVFVEEGPGQYRRQNVVIQKRQGKLVQVAQDTGLYPADRVVTTGSHELASLLSRSARPFSKRAPSASFFAQNTLRLSPEAERNIGLQIEQAQRRTVVEVITLNGTVDLLPRGRAVVSARLAGTLDRITIDRDQTVRAGDVVAEVASLEFQNLQLELLRNHLQFGLLEDTIRRMRAAEDVLPERMVRERRAALITARQRLDSLQSKLRATGLTPAQIEGVREGKSFFAALPVRAPISGVVVRFRAVLGQAVKAEDPLFEIHDLTAVNLRLSVAERDLHRVKVGQRGRVRLMADPTFPGEAVITQHGRALATGNRRLQVWAELRTRPATPLLPGMMVRLALIGSQPPATLAVPRDALFRDGLLAYLFVREEDDTFERRQVKTGRSDDRFVEITRGLAEGESVAVRGVADLQTAYASIQ